MKYNRKFLPGIFIASISVRTNNNNGQAQKDIGNLWAEWRG